MTQSRRATIVIGLGFGDCGKGSIIDFLSRNGDVHTVVRFNGGPQAGHNVVTCDGKHHTFSQFGSGSLAGESIATLLSRFMLIEPYALINEAAHLQLLGCANIWDRLFIDQRCAVITPAHQAMNRLREFTRVADAHGTCGLGIGETTQDILERPELTIFARELSDPARVTVKLRGVVEFKQTQMKCLLETFKTPEALPAQIEADLQTIQKPTWIEVAVDAYAAIASAARIISPADADLMLQRPGECLFEGAQGVLLDEDFGFHPHTTWSRATTANALQLLREAGITENIRRIGVLRSYMTRHGAGPLVTQDAELLAALTEPHNTSVGRQGEFRVGVFDAVAARYAVAASPVDEIAITHLDRLPSLPGYFCTAYEPCDEFVTESGTDISLQNPADFEQRTLMTRALNTCKPIFSEIQTKDPDAFVRRVETELRLPARLVSTGPTADQKRLRC